jgi:hypothetical protein
VIIHECSFSVVKFTPAIIEFFNDNPFWSSFVPNKTSVIVLKFRILLRGTKIYEAMRMNAKIQNLLLEFICLLYILLFVYAAFSKLFDFENFLVQLGQSPLLSAYARWSAYGVPFLEIIIAILLMVQKFRLIGLFASYTLMVLFTAYICILLNYSAFVPCSCGGIIQKLSWSQHIIFNCCFIALAGIAILLLPVNSTFDNPQIAKS